MIVKLLQKRNQKEKDLENYASKECQNGLVINFKIAAKERQKIN